MNRMASLVLLVLGIVLVVWGLNASDSFGSNVSRLFTALPLTGPSGFWSRGSLSPGPGCSVSPRDRG